MKLMGNLQHFPKVFTSSAFIWLMFVLSSSFQFKIRKEQLELDAILDCKALIESKGYGVEDHSVVTADGYILSLLRINGERNSCCGNMPHLLAHGLLGSACDFFLNLKASSIGFALLDVGCDVWTLNVRGNKYSRRHVKLNPNEKEFWDFTSIEMALYDLPAAISFVQNATGAKKINFVGYSQGALALIALLSDKPEYNSQINKFVAMAPSPFTSHGTGLLNIIKHFSGILTKTLDVFHKYEFMPYDGVVQKWLMKTCSRKRKFFCKGFLNSIVGVSTETNYTRMPVFANNYFLGTSVKTMDHYAQISRSEKFKKFDYGRKRNRKQYGQASPPEFNLTNVDVPITIFSGITDAIINPKDIQILKQILGSKIVASYQLPDGDTTKNSKPTWNHVDYMVAANVQYMVIPQMLQAFGHKCG